MRQLKGKVTEVRHTGHGRFAVIAVRDEMYPDFNLFDHLHLACDEVTAVGDEISASIAILSERAAKAAD